MNKKSDGDRQKKKKTWGWRRVETASQTGGKRESKVKVTSVYRRRTDSVLLT